MYSNKKLYILLFFVVAVVASCSEDSGYIGVLPENENLTTTEETHSVFTSSIPLDSVPARSLYYYLGRIYDPETKGLITSDYATQFSILEGVQLFPDKKYLASWEKHGRDSFPKCDSVLLSLSFDRFYGDYNTPLKVSVYPLSKDKKHCLREDTVYYTNSDLEQHIDPAYKDHPLVSHVFTAYNRSHSSDPVNASSTSWPSIRIPLPPSVGDSVMRAWYKYWDDKKAGRDDYLDEYDFDDSYHFAHTVLPGFYIKVAQGEGTMVRVFVNNLYFIYQSEEETEDTTITGDSYTRLSGTPEVVQSCSYKQSDLASLLAQDNDSTWLKTPAGICTQLNLEIDSVMGKHQIDEAEIADMADDDPLFRDTHYTDSISRLQLVLQRYNKEQTEFQFAIPQKLLLIPENEVDSFFLNGGETADGITTYVATFSTTYNTYDFSNIGRLYVDLYRNRDSAVRAELKKDGITNPTYKQIYMQTADWVTRHPNWDTAQLIPVETSTNSSTSTVTSVVHDLSLSSACLVRGTKEKPIKIQVFYVNVNDSSE